MSGGVDSSVAAYLLTQQGYDCTGATMRLFDDEMAGVVLESGCCSLADVEDARAVCTKLGIPHYTLNFADEFTERVIEPFVSAYQRGETPNPCIDCNRYLKFEHLLARALTLGYDYVATGHYVRIGGASPGLAPLGRNQPLYHLLRGVDPSKDQSYVLYSLTQQQLAHTLFPLGELTKQQVREIAGELGLVTAEKPESQDICFVPEGNYRNFIERHTGAAFEAGPIVNTSGQRIGTHDGLAGFTVGQRKGIGVAVGHPLFVVRIDVANNTLVVGEESELTSGRVLLRDVNIISGEPLGAPLQITAKHRYRSTEQPATLTQTGSDTAEVVFDQPEKAVTPGQALVFYQGDEVLGGGTIIESS
jgi:tRNA-specific 2-thiouridylase